MKLAEAKRIFIAGHRGMVGSALVRALSGGDAQVLTRSRGELDLCNAHAVADFYRETNPDIAIIAAARVGGIHANSTYPAEFIQQNVAIALNTIHEAWRAGVPRVLFLGSTCIYPREAPQPMPEDCLLASPLESTNEAYAIAKITGLKLCQFYRQQYGVLYHSAMPTNLYGPGDNYHPENAHVMPALIRRFHESKEAKAPSVTVWGTGKPRREFLHVDDLADGLLHLLSLDSPPDWVNLGTGSDVTIQDLAEKVAEAVGYQGEIVFDSSRPDGTPRKLVDVSRMKATGWMPRYSLEDGIAHAYEDFLKGSYRQV